MASPLYRVESSQIESSGPLCVWFSLLLFPKPIQRSHRISHRCTENGNVMIIIVIRTRITIKSYKMLRFCFRITYDRIRCLFHSMHTECCQFLALIHTFALLFSCRFIFARFARRSLLRSNRISVEWNEIDDTIHTHMLGSNLIKMMEKATSPPPLLPYRIQLERTRRRSESEQYFESWNKNSK